MNYSSSTCLGERMIKIKPFSDEKQLVSGLGCQIEEIANAAIRQNDIFHVGFSGGSLIRLLEECLPGVKTDWEKWKIYFCDERLVPFDDEDSTYGLYKKSLKGKIPIKDEQYVAISPQLTAADAAVDYQKKLEESFGTTEIPRFDLLLLGMGPDGHTCSLFPGHPLLNEKTKWVAPITDSPKPPPSRVTLTYPVINNAQNIVFALSGKAKANLIKKILEDREDFPVTRINQTSGMQFWLLDEEAASELKKE